MALTKVTRNYQITLPKEMREIAHIKMGDTIIVDATEEAITLKKRSPKEILNSAFGIWKDMKEDSVTYVRKMRAESEKRLKRLGL